MALVESDCGREVALEVMVFLKRPGGQAQYSQLLQAHTEDSTAFDDLHLWIDQNLNHEHLTV